MEYKIYTQEQKTVTEEEYLAHYQRRINRKKDEIKAEKKRHNKAMGKLDADLFEIQLTLAYVDGFIGLCSCGRIMLLKNSICIGVNFVAKQETAWFNCACGSTKTCTGSEIVTRAKALVKTIQ